MTAGTVTFVHDQRFPPFVDVQDGRSTGLAVRVLEAAAARAGIVPSYLPLPFDQVKTALAEGHADALFPLAINPERRAEYDFTTPLLVTGGGLFVRAPASPASDPAAFDGRTIVTPGTGPLAGFIQRGFPAVRLQVTTDYDESLALLMAGAADAAALNFHAGARIAARLYPGAVVAPVRLFLELPLAVAVPKGKRADLIVRLDAALAAIRADGTWDRLQTATE